MAADNVPRFDVELALDPTAGNPLGIKGGGEGGITPAPAVVINALVDALKEFGIDHIDMPATPLRIWTAIENARHGVRHKGSKARTLGCHCPRKRTIQ